MSRASQPDKQNGTLSADTIRASGHVQPHQKAGHKTAPDHNAKPSNQPLQSGRHPHRTLVTTKLAVFRASGSGIHVFPMLKEVANTWDWAFGRRERAESEEVRQLVRYPGGLNREIPKTAVL
jgi:hypothetical protein